MPINFDSNGLMLFPRHLIGSNGQKIEYALCLQFLTTNNVAKYEALILSF